MKFYHFTTVRYLRPDGTPGTVEVRKLPPLSSALSRGIATGPIDSDGVWLTTDPEPGGEGAYNCVRIELKLPARHRALEPYASWIKRVGLTTDTVALSARRYLPGCPEGELRRRLEAWWLYWGRIPASRFTDLEILDGKHPWWLG